MRFPHTSGDPHIRKYRFETGFLRAASINTEPYLARALPHMTDSHLTEGLPVIGAFNTVIIVGGDPAGMDVLEVNNSFILTMSRNGVQRDII